MWIRGPVKKPFTSVMAVLNGRLVNTRDWVVGLRTPSSTRPLARRSFVARFGADNGARYGSNRLTVTAWNATGRFDRVSLRIRIGRPSALASAGEGGSTQAGRLVVLNGAKTHVPRGAKVTYRWAIISAPKGSKTRLMAADSARPRLRPDRAGRYRIRLTAWPRRPGATHQALTAADGGVDETTVQATVPTPPIGVPIQTIASGGGIRVDGQTYSAPAGSWAQVLVLDRQTLQVISNQGVGNANDVTVGAANQLGDVLGDQDATDLVVVSGGGRAASGVTTSYPMGSDLQNMLSQGGAGASGGAVRSAPGAWQQSLQSGRWSFIGVPNVYGSANANLFGLTFASGASTSIDTQPANTPANEAEIQIGSQTYRSSALSAGQSGFYVLALDPQLQEKQAGTYVTNTNSTGNPTGVQQLANTLNQLAATPGYLVVVQSIGRPNGSGQNWDFDPPLTSEAFTTAVNAPVPNDSSVWGQTSLAAAMGALGGPAAHAQIAQMVTPAYSQPNPSYDGGGYTLVASTGAVQDFTAMPVTRSQIGSQAAQARVTGMLQRSRQSLWTVSSSGWLGKFAPSSLAQLAYQAPTAWPDSSTSAEQAANTCIAGQLNYNVSDVREQYVQDSGADWNTQANNLQNVDYPGPGKGFDEPTFAAVKKELHSEMLDVSEVNQLFSNLTGLFVQGTQSGYIDPRRSPNRCSTRCRVPTHNRPPPATRWPRPARASELPRRSYRWPAKRSSPARWAWPQPCSISARTSAPTRRVHR